MKVLALLLLSVALVAAHSGGQFEEGHLNLGAFSESEASEAVRYAPPLPAAIAPAFHPFNPSQRILARGETALTGVTIHKAVRVAVSQPVAVPFVRNVPYPVQVPVGVPVDRPYPVHVDRPYPVHVDRPYPVEVIREVPEPYEVIEKVPVEVPVYVPHYRDVPVPHYIPKHVPVPAPYPVTILVKEHIHKKGGWFW